MVWIILWLGLVSPCLLLPDIRAQSVSPMAGTVDAGFSRQVQLSGADAAEAYAFAVQPDGKVLVAGNFGLVNGQPRRNLARLNADGSLDTGFDPGVGVDWPLGLLAIQSDGKIVVAGLFQNVNLSPRSFLARINADGSLDQKYDPGITIDGAVSGLLIQPDGKLLIAGSFRNVSGVARYRLARLNPDGSLDAGFDPGSAAGFYQAANSADYVSQLALEPGGKLFVLGSFLVANDVPRRKLICLKTDGSLDPGFDPAAGTTDGYVSSLAVQPDGKILLGGYFRHIGSLARSSVARLEPDGRPDPTFDPGAGPGTVFSSNGRFPEVNALLLQPDGRIVVGGYFDYFGDRALNGVLRLNSDGSTDPNFGVDVGPTFLETGVNALGLQADGKILVGGGFMTFSDSSYFGLVRLQGDPAPTVSVVGTPDRGGFVVSRVGRPDASLRVVYHHGGAAIRGQDYVAFTGETIIPIGQTDAVIPVTLLPGANRNRKVKVFLDADPDGVYRISKTQSKVYLGDLP